MVDCGMASDPECFLNRMNGCLPVTAKMMGSDGETEIEITIFGSRKRKVPFSEKIKQRFRP